jgi:hypothetical protein
MSAVLPDTIPRKPSLFKQALVGVVVGATLGPVIGWFIGTFVTFFTSVWLDDSMRGIRGMKTTAFIGGLLGIPFGFMTGVLVAPPVRLAFLSLPENRVKRWVVGTVGCLLGFGSSYLIHQFWNPSEISFAYLIIHSVIVGGVTGAVASLAKPKWL